MSNFKAKQGQDKWVLSVLKNKKKGFFLEIGAHNGKDDSNAYVLEKDFEWQGICVEPHTYSFELLTQNRSSICENVCVSNIDGKVKFVQRGRKRQVSGIYDDFSDDIIINKAENGHPIVEKNSTTLLRLLKKHKCKQVIDYLSIDVEGAEYEILKDFPFDEYKFLAITLEHNKLLGERNVLKRTKIFELLCKSGYRRVNEGEYEDWYVYCPNLDSQINDFNDMEMIGNYYRSIGKKIVSTNGCFDILHKGHIDFLEQCKSVGDILIVLLNSDSSIKSLKGEDRPIIDENSRLTIMSHIDFVDHVYIFKDQLPCKALKMLKTDIHCKGSDYHNNKESLPEKTIVENYNGKIEIIPLDHQYSTTKIINKINND